MARKGVGDVVGEDFTEKVTFGQRPEKWERTTYKVRENNHTQKIKLWNYGVFFLQRYNIQSC